ncbi:unnamed protein product, partial [Nesidiocoris tenuis]
MDFIKFQYIDEFLEARTPFLDRPVHRVFCLQPFRQHTFSNLGVKGPFSTTTNGRNLTQQIDP